MEDEPHQPPTTNQQCLGKNVIWNGTRTRDINDKTVSAKHESDDITLIYIFCCQRIHVSECKPIPTYAHICVSICVGNGIHVSVCMWVCLFVSLSLSLFCFCQVSSYLFTEFFALLLAIVNIRIRIRTHIHIHAHICMPALQQRQNQQCRIMIYEGLNLFFNQCSNVIFGQMKSRGRNYSSIVVYEWETFFNNSF